MSAPVVEGVRYSQRWRATWREGNKRHQWTWYAPYAQAARESLERYLDAREVPTSVVVTVRYCGTVPAWQPSASQAPREVSTGREPRDA